MPSESFVRELVQETEKRHVAGAPWAEMQSECPCPSVSAPGLASFPQNTEHEFRTIPYPQDFLIVLRMLAFSSTLRHNLEEIETPKKY